MIILNNMNSKLLPFLFIPIALFFFGCDRTSSDLHGDEMARFNAWIDVNGYTSYKTASGLYYISEKEGTGIAPSDSDVVLYSYVVRNLDGYIYMNSYKDTAKLYSVYDLYKPTTHYVPTVNQFLPKTLAPKGLYEGLSKMKEGGKAKLIMPSSLAYGKNGSGLISTYTSLIWDVELVKVFKGSLAEYENSLIDEYVTKCGYTPLSDTVYFKSVWSSGTGSIIDKDSIVKVNYIGSYLDSVIFDTNIKSVAIDSNIYNSTSSYTPLEFKMGSTSRENNVGMKSEPPLKGFQFAVKQMKQGDTADFVIPSKYMYGVIGTSNIPPYTPLRFRIIVVDVRVKP